MRHEPPGRAVRATDDVSAPANWLFCRFLRRHAVAAWSMGLQCGVAFVVSALEVAIPAGFEPATHGVEIRWLINEINVLSRSCYIDVASALIFAVRRTQQ